MKNFLFLFVLNLTTLGVLYAQPGTVFIQNYPKKSIIETNYAITQDKSGSVYFANAKGVLVYDGIDWRLVNAQGTVYSVSVSTEDKEVVYVGGLNHFGYLRTNIFGKKEFYSLSATYKDFDAITDIAQINGKVYFYSDLRVFVYNVSQKQIEKVWEPEKGKRFMGWFIHQNKIFLNKEDKGLEEIKDNSNIISVPNTQGFGSFRLQTYFTYNSNFTCIGTSDNRLWNFNGQAFFPVNTIAQNYINSNVLRQAVNVSETEFVVSTASGGCLVIDKMNGYVKNIINFQMGLADDEVQAVFADKHQGLWICHANGISRAFLTLPITNYSTYPGLEGNATTVIRMGYQLYVGTSEGVFMLVQGDGTEQVSKRVVPQQTRRMPARTLRDKFKRATETRSQANNSPIVVVVETSTNSEIQNNKGMYALQGTSYYYRKVQGIQSKCKQLVVYKGRLIAATNTGLFEIGGGVAYQISPEAQVNEIFVSESLQRVYVAFEGGLWSLKEKVGGWEKLDTLANLNENIHSVVKKDDELWLGGKNKIFRVALDTSGLSQGVGSYNLPLDYSENIAVTLAKGKPLFFLFKNIFAYSNFFETLQPATEWKKYASNDLKLIHNQVGAAWLYAQGKWQSLKDSIKNEKLKASHLSVFRSIDSIFEDIEDNLWIADNGKVYKIAAKTVNNEAPYEIFVKGVKTQEGVWLDFENSQLHIPQGVRNFSFSLASPFYLSEQETEYQYRVEGLSNSEWSVWRKQADIEFAYLPADKYVLEVRGRNVLGQVSPVYRFPFSVKPPFWETWWFYLIQLGLLLGLLVASVFTNRTHQQNRFGSVITLVTIITVFEFFALKIEPYTDLFSAGVPVFKLLMNIFLAISLVPLEKKVRHFLETSPLIDDWTHRIHKKGQNITQKYSDKFTNFTDKIKNRREE